MYENIGGRYWKIYKTQDKTIKTSNDRVIVISNTDIENILEHIKSIIEPHKIEHLKFRHCRIKELPDLTEFYNLYYLDISNCSLEKINNLPQTLKSLNISKNRLKSLPNIEKMCEVVCDIENIIEMPKINNYIYLDIHKNDTYTQYEKHYRKIYKQYKINMLLLKNLKLPYDLKRKLLQDHFIIKING